MKKENYKRILLSILISLTSLIALIPFFDKFEKQLEYSLFKSRYHGKVREGSIDDIVIVDIDERSVSDSKLGNYFEWKRDYFAQTIDVIKNKKSSVIGLDILMSKSKDNSRDSLFTTVLKKKSSVILGYRFDNPDKYQFMEPDSIPFNNFNTIPFSADNFYAEKKFKMNIGSEILMSNANGGGFLNITKGVDGVISSTPLFIRYFNKLYPSFAMQICLNYFGIKKENVTFNDQESIVLKNAEYDNKIKDIVIPLNENNEMDIHYQGTWQTFRTVSFYDVMKNRIGKKLLKNKIVLIGASLPGLMDLRSTPVQENLPGVEVHANIINTIIKQNFITRFDRKYLVILILFFILLTNLILFSRVKTLLSLIIILLYSSTYIYITHLLFNRYDILVDQSRPLYAIIFSFLVAAFVSYNLENREKKFIKNTLGKYIPTEVSKVMLADSSKLRLGGERKYISMLFTDIRNFSSISEMVSPEELIEFLNIYLMRMTAVIKRNQGTLDKFIGDCIVCLFGAPLTNKHVYNSCKAALEMQEELKKMRPEFKNEIFQKLEIGIGVNTGFATVGNIGSVELFDYTAIGDNMNLASRVEGANKYYGTTVLVTHNTYKDVEQYFEARLIDIVKVKGRNSSVKLYELLYDKKEADTAKTEKYQSLKKAYEKTFALYSKGSFKEAITLFDDIYDKYQDKTSLVMAVRCRELLAKDMDQGWNGVWRMDSK